MKKEETKKEIKSQLKEIDSLESEFNELIDPEISNKKIEEKIEEIKTIFSSIKELQEGYRLKKKQWKKEEEELKQKEAQTMIRRNRLYF